METWDPKEGSWVPGDLDIRSYAGGVTLSHKLFPILSRNVADLVVLRSLQAWEAIHERGQYYLQTSYADLPDLSRQLPCLGSVTAYESESSRTPDDFLPPFLAIGVGDLLPFSAGFLSRRYAPFKMPFTYIGNGIPNLHASIDADRLSKRIQLLESLEGANPGSYGGLDDNALRRLGSRAMNALRSRITHIHMTDQGCMLRAYSRGIIDAINACREVSTFIPALAYTFARSPAEVEVAHERRAAGESKYSLYSLVRLNFDLVTGFSVVPLQMFSLFGIAIAVISVLVYFAVMIQRTLAGNSALEIFWDRDILQFFLTGIVLFGVGLVGEYVGRIYQQVRQRPRYLVQAVLEKTTSDSWQQERSSSATGT